MVYLVCGIFYVVIAYIISEWISPYILDGDYVKKYARFFEEDEDSINNEIKFILGILWPIWLVCLFISLIIDLIKLPFQKHNNE